MRYQTWGTDYVTESRGQICHMTSVWVESIIDFEISNFGYRLLLESMRDMLLYDICRGRGCEIVQRVISYQSWGM